MTILHNEITIDAPIEKIWSALSNVETLEQFDPTVKRSKAVTAATSGPGAGRKVEMLDGKNWFEEKCITWRPHEALAYELTACSFPIHQLNHAYSFEKDGEKVTVKQVMAYKIKYGVIGKILDALMVRKQTQTGIKKFFVGLKNYAERP